ncbi:MAG: PilC/PilY family type IV pilus protein [Steroidobacteraceae bacterium]
MKNSGSKPVRHISTATLAVALAFAPAMAVKAEDIDLFVSASTTAVANPNVLIIIDNTANWNRNDQHWTDPNGLIFPFKQGQSELRALKRVAEEATDKINLGLMFFRGGSPDGTFVRDAVRTMNATNKANLAAMIGDQSCVDGTAANGTPRCIFKNYSGGEQTAQADGDYSAALFDAFKYFGGCTSPVDAQSGVCKTNIGRTAFGVPRYSGDSPLSSSAKAYYDQAAYTDSTMDFYIPPVGTANSCARNYVIFIGNGFPNQDAPASLLAGVEGNTSQLAMPNFTTTEETTTTIIGTSCGTGTSETNRRNNCTANIPQSLKDKNPADTYQCISPEANDQTACPNSGGQTRKFNVEATKTVFTVTATGTSSVPSTSDARMADEWARYLFTTDVNGAPGVQNVTTYTIDVFKDKQDQKQTALLFSMAKYGGGRYFAAASEDAILKALQDILIEIQSVNSVFASASLPINATNRSQNENQVFIGMFRPDPTARPRWYGNLKRYQIAQFGQEFKLADASTPPQEAVSSATGFIQPCAVSFWTTDTTSFDPNNSSLDTSYWAFSDTSGSHAGTCTTSTTSLYSDLPDGPQVEKGATGEVVRLGNVPGATPDFLERRTIYTCSNNGTSIGCNTAVAMHNFDTTNVSQAAVAAADATEHSRIVSYTRGLDLFDENSRLSNSDVRPTVHGDVSHSRPLPVNYGGTGGFNVVLFYGANDGTFRAVDGTNGKEVWSFVAPEHHGKLKRLLNNDPLIAYPPTPAPGSTPKDYFFDGSAGLFQNVDNSKIWVFPSMRRGGRMLYAFDVTSPTAPRLKWRVGCTNPSLSDTASCIDASGAASGLFTQMGQSWSTAAVALVKGFSADPNTPVIIVGGGYDSCDDQDAAPNTACTATGYTRRGNRVYVINANTGALEKEFVTNGSVPADVTLVDRDFDGFADHAYVADTTGRFYRIDFVDPANPGTIRAKADWTITEIAHTSAANRKFLFSPAGLPASGKVYLSATSGDRERPLIVNYPFITPVVNRAYMLVDTFTTGSVNLDDPLVMENLTAGSDCNTPPPETTGKRGWFIDLNTGTGEQGVTSSTIFGGLVFFSTNRAVPTPPGACTNNLGEARGYALNLLNASGAADTLNICGGARSQVFIGGGLPPSPVTGTVPVGGRPVTVMIGGVQRGGSVSSPIGAQRVEPSITQRRSRVYWYTDGDK